jgi:ribose transport system permease protein
VTALGAVSGTINGLIRTRIGMPSFIVTLAMLVAYRSAALIASGERPLTTRGRTPFYTFTGGELFGIVPWHVVWMLVIMAIGGLVLARTRFGYHLYATGGNLEAARFAGINTDRLKLAAFVLTGALCGLIGALLFGYLRVAEPTTGTGFEFRVIGAVIVGGVALTGGRGTIYGSLVGGLIISMITSGLVLLGYSQDVGDVATGALIIAAGTLGLIVRRATSRRLGILA